MTIPNRTTPNISMMDATAVLFPNIAISSCFTSPYIPIRQHFALTETSLSPTVKKQPRGKHCPGAEERNLFHVFDNTVCDGIRSADEDDFFHTGLCEVCPGFIAQLVSFGQKKRYMVPGRHESRRQGIGEFLTRRQIRRVCGFVEMRGNDGRRVIAVFSAKAYRCSRQLVDTGLRDRGVSSNDGRFCYAVSCEGGRRFFGDPPLSDKKNRDASAGRVGADRNRIRIVFSGRDHGDPLFADFFYDGVCHKRRRVIAVLSADAGQAASLSVRVRGFFRNGRLATDDEQMFCAQAGQSACSS